MIVGVLELVAQCYTRDSEQLRSAFGIRDLLFLK